tara:strand:- start:341 stop:571 length:231 start_codon:yes stop_codon:yes gene_type:complete
MSKIDPKLTFDSFVVGPVNSLASAVGGDPDYSIAVGRESLTHCDDRDVALLLGCLVQALNSYKEAVKANLEMLAGE